MHRDKSLMRPHVLLCTVLVTQLQENLIVGKNAKIVTIMLHELVGLSYKEKLDRQGHFFECRRLRDNLLEVYEIIRGMDNVEESKTSRMGLR